MAEFDVIYFDGAAFDSFIETTPIIFPVGIASTLKFGVISIKQFSKLTSIPRYIIEIHNSNGELISIIENAYGKSYTRGINEPSTLSFAIPGDDVKKSYLVLPNEIWLKDYGTGTVVKKFRITRTQKVEG